MLHGALSLKRFKNHSDILIIFKQISMLVLVLIDLNDFTGNMALYIIYNNVYHKLAMYINTCAAIITLIEKG